MGNDSSRLRSQIKENNKYINILLVGEQGAGKSCFINTVNSAITEQRDNILAEPANQGYKGGRTTADYRMFDLKSAKIRLFDLPGADFATESEQNVLRTILQGIPSPTEFRFGGDGELLDPRVRVEAKNKIDMVFFLVDPTSIQNWVGERGLNEEGRDYYKSIVNLAKRHCNGLSPYMVYTKRDKTYLSAEELMAAFAWFPDTNKWVITNYTRRGQHSSGTDEVALKMIHNVVNLFRALS